MRSLPLIGLCVGLAALMLVLAFFSLRGESSEELVVFAASSLTDAFLDLADDFEAQNPGVNVLFNFGGSSSLAAQIREGAPSDIFASANPVQMSRIADSALLSEDAHVFAMNRLVVVVPATNPAGVQTFFDLAKGGVGLVLAARGVPIREYAELVLELATADDATAFDFRTAVLENLVSDEDNVRQVVVKVALNEADAGIVYQSDVTPDLADQVTVIAIPDEYNVTASYLIAPLTGNSVRNLELARLFVTWVLSDAGQATLIRYGLSPVDSST